MRGRARRGTGVRGSGTSLGTRACRCRRRHERCPRARPRRPSCASACGPRRSSSATSRTCSRGASAAARRGSSGSWCARSRAPASRPCCTVPRRRCARPATPSSSPPPRDAPTSPRTTCACSASAAWTASCSRSPTPSDPATRTELERVQVPCVLYDRQVEWLDASCVLLDHAPSARVAGAQLLGLGHRRIAFVAGTPTVRVTPEVEHGLRLAMEGVPDAELLVEDGEFSEEYGRKRTLRAAVRRGAADGADRRQCPARPRRPPGAARAAPAAGARHLAGLRGGSADPARGRPAGGRHQLGLPARRARARGAAPAAPRRAAPRNASWCAPRSSRASRARHRRPPASLDILASACFDRTQLGTGSKGGIGTIGRRRPKPA